MMVRSPFMLFEERLMRLSEASKKVTDPATEQEQEAFQQIAKEIEDIANITVEYESALMEVDKMFKAKLKKRAAKLDRTMELFDTIRQTKVIANNIIAKFTRDSYRKSTKYKSVLEELGQTKKSLLKQIQALEIKYTSNTKQPDKLKITDRRNPKTEFTTDHERTTNVPAIVAEGILGDLQDKIEDLWNWFVNKTKSILPQAKDVLKRLEKIEKTLDEIGQEPPVTESRQRTYFKRFGE